MEEFRSVKEMTGGDTVVEREERRRRRVGVFERFGGRRWRRRERRSVAVESDVEAVKFGWVVEGVGGGAEVVPVAGGKWCWWF